MCMFHARYLLARLFAAACAMLALCALPAHAVDSFSFIVAADPQPWRLDNGIGSNSDGNRQNWLNVANPTYTSMSTLGAKFMIINGDMTEFGRAETWKDTLSAPGNAHMPVLFGLGNHDYLNNVGDCADGISTYFDHCAVESVVNLTFQYRPEVWNNYGGLNGLNIIRNDWKITTDTDKLLYDVTGSLAYSFEYGGVHFIQLNLCPTYVRSFSDDNYEVNITSAMDWLTGDISAARAFGFKVIMNYHAPNNPSCPLPQLFMTLLKYVDVIFNGDLHEFQYDNNLGVPRFIVDAIYQGGYYLVSVNNDGVSVQQYNGLTGTANALNQPQFVPFKVPSPVISNPPNGSTVYVPPQPLINGTGIPGAALSASVQYGSAPPSPFCNIPVAQNGAWDCSSSFIGSNSSPNTLTVTQTYNGKQSDPAYSTFYIQVDDALERSKR
jgi:hypothetical protein